MLVLVLNVLVLHCLFPCSFLTGRDLIFVFGIGKKERLALLSYNIERHGIKSMKFPEIKT